MSSLTHLPNMTIFKDTREVGHKVNLMERALLDITMRISTKDSSIKVKGKDREHISLTKSSNMLGSGKTTVSMDRVNSIEMKNCSLRGGFKMG